MSVTLNINGTDYFYPETSDVSWGNEASGWAEAVTNGMLQKSGGLFQLLAEVDFGSTYGIKSSYYKSRTANIASIGALRLARADVVAWRNEANDNDLSLAVNSSNELTYGGVKLLISGAIVNADINASAAIALSKLATVTASRALQSDGSGLISASSVTNTELGYVAGVTSAIQTQLDARIANNLMTTKGDLISYSTLPARLGVGSDGAVLTADSAQTLGVKWATPASAPSASYEIANLSLATSVGSSALTIAVKDASGSDPSGGSPVKIGMRSATLTSGLYNQRSITAALSLVISSGSTLGQTSGQASTIFVYVIDNAGTLELAVSHTLYREDVLVTTTAEGGAGGADSATAIYSSTSRSSVPLRLIGKIINTQTTAGTWASAGTQIQVAPFAVSKVPTVQKFTSSSGTYYTPAGATYIRVRLVGGGGGGAGSAAVANNNGGNGGTGGNTTFGTSLLEANGGQGGQGAGGSGAGGTGGAVSLASPAIGMAIAGGRGQGFHGSASSTPSRGSMGAVSPFGGGSGGCTQAGVGENAVANSGSGGGGAGANSAQYSGASGGSGGYIDAIIFNPLSSYAYAIGAAGTAGSAGTSGTAGGTGGSGFIIVEEFYQ